MIEVLHVLMHIMLPWSLGFLYVRSCRACKTNDIALLHVERSMPDSGLNILEVKAVCRKLLLQSAPGLLGLIEGLTLLCPYVLAFDLN